MSISQSFSFYELYMNEDYKVIPLQGYTVYLNIQVRCGNVEGKGFVILIEAN